MQREPLQARQGTTSTIWDSSLSVGVEKPDHNEKRIDGEPLRGFRRSSQKPSEKDFPLGDFWLCCLSSCCPLHVSPAGLRVASASVKYRWCSCTHCCHWCCISCGCSVGCRHGCCCIGWWSGSATKGGIELTAGDDTLGARHLSNASLNVKSLGCLILG